MINRGALTGVLSVILMLVCFVIAFGIVILIAKTLPSDVGIATCYFMPIVSFVMMTTLLRSIKNYRTSLSVTIFILVVFTTLAFVTAVDKTTAVVYDTRIMMSMTFIACSLAVLPFILKNKYLHFSKYYAKRDSIYFGASVMWLSPLFADTLFLIKWGIEGILFERLESLTLGGAGFNDVLFFYGAIAFLTITLFHLITRFLHFLWISILGEKYC